MTRTGADLLAQTLTLNGIDTCFANPGTTEMHLLAALGATPGMRLQLCLFEGVATGAADGYARMSGKPAAVLLHLGPGLANGMANLHNARKADTPVFVMVGEHATYHLAHDAPLTADIAGMAATVSESVRTPQTADAVGAEAGALLAGAGGVATMILPNDVAWSPTEAEPKRIAARPAPGYDQAALNDALALLRAPGGALILGAPVITRRMAALATAIGTATGCTVLTEAAVSRMERGGETPALSRVPFHVDFATVALKDLRGAVLVGARAPVAFFAYPDRPSALLPEGAEVLPLCAPRGDVEGALAALAAALQVEPSTATHPAIPGYDAAGPITPESLAAVVASHLPEGAIVVDESITSGAHLFALCGRGPRHDWLNNRGGSIGYSFPVAVGAATACPDRPVLCLTGDGSAFYTLQALWTMAREKLDITVLVMANRSYRILANESSKIGAGAPTDTTLPLMSLSDPAPDWVKLAEGHGVAARSVDTAGGLAEALAEAFGTPGPRLIEVRL